MGAQFCPNCGQAVGAASSSAQSSHSELDNLARDRDTQEHWFYRLIAYIIDAIIVGIAVYILELIVSLALFPPAIAFPIIGFPFLALAFSLAAVLGSLAFVFYFTFAEWLYGTTIGKNLFHLRVVVVDGTKLDFGKAFTRNISKIFWVLLLLDILGGLVSKTRRGQKYSDYIANTNVVRMEIQPPQTQVSGQTA